MTLLDHQFLLNLPKRRGFTKCTIDNNMYANIYILGIPNRASKSGIHISAEQIKVTLGKEEKMR